MDILPYKYIDDYETEPINMMKTKNSNILLFCSNCKKVLYEITGVNQGEPIEVKNVIAKAAHVKTPKNGYVMSCTDCSTPGLGFLKLQYNWRQNDFERLVSLLDEDN